jgi:alkylmercury lyase
VAELLKVGDPGIQLSLAALDQLADVLARRLAFVAQNDDAADLVEGEPARLGGTNEGQPVNDARVVVAVPVRRTIRRSEHADRLPVADRLGRNLGAGGQFTDQHGLRLRLDPLDLPAGWKVHHRSGMDITIVHVSDCPHVDLAQQRIAAALAQLGMDAAIQLQLVTSEHEAVAAGCHGSPTVLIDGRDPFDQAAGTVGLACRIYRTEAGTDGAPSVADLVEALRRHGRRSPLEMPSDLAQHIRRAAFDRLRTGHPLPLDDLIHQLDVSPDQVAAALEALAGTGLVEQDPTGAITSAHGLTLAPTQHHLVLDDIELWTWCALDAVGIPAALETDAQVATPCGSCGRPLTLTMSAGAPDPADDLMLWLPREPCTNVRQQFCPDANLFCTHDHLQRWRDKQATPTGRS